jgi:hypothetical protein
MGDLEVFKQSLVAIITGMVALGVTACGGGGEDEEEDEGPEDASGAGIWSGTYRLDGQITSSPMFGLVTEEGDFTLVAVGNATRPARFFFGTGTTNGNSFSANALSYFAPGTTPSSLAGTVTDRSTISGSYSLSGESATFSLTYRNAYERASSFATLSGVYTLTIPASGTTPAGTITVDIATTGSFTYTASVTGCTITGSFTTPHSNRNYYRWTGTSSGCAAGNGAMSGTAYLDDNAAGTNRVLTLLGQNQAQTAALFVVVSK